MRTHGLLHGGGLDSTLLFCLMSGLFKLEGTERFPSVFAAIHCDYGHLASLAEMEAVKNQTADIGTLSNVTPYRMLLRATLNLPETNMLMDGKLDSPIELDGRNEALIRCAHHNGITDIWIGAENVLPPKSPMADCTREFFDRMEKELSTGFLPVTIHTPFLNIPADEYQRIMSGALTGLYGEDVKNVMSHAMTCYRPVYSKSGDKHCGVCPHCVKLGQLRGGYVSR